MIIKGTLFSYKMESLKFFSLDPGDLLLPLIGKNVYINSSGYQDFISMQVQLLIKMHW